MIGAQQVSAMTVCMATTMATRSSSRPGGIWQLRAEEEETRTAPVMMRRRRRRRQM